MTKKAASQEIEVTRCKYMQRTSTIEENKFLLKCKYIICGPLDTVSLALPLDTPLRVATAISLQSSSSAKMLRK